MEKKKEIGGLFEDGLRYLLLLLLLTSSYRQAWGIYNTIYWQGKIGLIIKRCEVCCFCCCITGEVEGKRELKNSRGILRPVFLLVGRTVILSSSLEGSLPPTLFVVLLRWSFSSFKIFVPDPRPFLHLQFTKLLDRNGPWEAENIYSCIQVLYIRRYVCIYI